MKIVITDIEWDTTDEAGDQEQSGLPSEVEVTEDSEFLSEIVEQAESEINGDTVTEYIHRSEDSNGKPTLLERVTELVEEAEEGGGELSDLLSDNYGYCVNGFSYEVVDE